jgi:pimeloyl-ACP methyl ester carboxylesterase
MDLTPHFIERPDGTRLCWYASGTRGPVLMLANGLGGPVSALRTYIRHFAQTGRVVTWDYRGLYASRLGPGASLELAAHAADARAVIAALGAPVEAFVGWSMGVQVGLELYRQEPEALERLVLMSGTAGRPFDAVLPPAGPKILEGLVGAAHRLRWAAPAAIRVLRGTPGTHGLLKRLGFISEAFAPALYREVLADFQSLDFDVYFRLLAALGRHDAEGVLGTVAVPTLVISGTRDRVTPPHLARRLVQGIRGAEYFALEAASHYAAAEYPELVIERIERFIRPSGLPGPVPFARVSAAS